MAARAGGTVFHNGIRLLAIEQRAALRAIREFATRVEQIGGGPLDSVARLRSLERQAAAVVELGSRSGSADPVIEGLAVAHERFGLPLDALAALVEGVRVDVLGDPHEDFDHLLLHCRRVGGSIARLGVSVLSSREPAVAAELAESLGIAAHLTTIVLDLRRDAERGRVYLPMEDFGRYHLLGVDQPTMTPAALAALAREASVAQPAALQGLDGGSQAQLYALMRFQVLRAEDWFHRGARLSALLDRRGGACVLVVSAYYGRLLQRIGQRPDRALDGRIVLPVHEQAWVAARGLLRRGSRELHPAQRLPLD